MSEIKYVNVDAETILAHQEKVDLAVGMKVLRLCDGLPGDTIIATLTSLVSYCLEQTTVQGHGEDALHLTIAHLVSITNFDASETLQ